MNRIKYQTEEERIAAKREYYKQYYEKHKEELADYQKQYQKQYNEEHKEKIAEYNKQYYETPFGRATKLLNRHRQSDKNTGRGECTLTAQWMVDNIFSKPCHWCGETDWKKIGCDRIDNSLPHTPDNVIPCCGKCNKKRNRKPYDEFKKKMG